MMDNPTGPLRPLQNPLLRAWIWLIGLSAGSALISAGIATGTQRQIAGTVIVVLALSKARIILARYLGLAQAPGWLTGFSWVIRLFGVLVLGLYLAPAIMP